MAIHPTAIVEDGALLGDGVEVGPFCVVSARATLGDGVRLIGHVSITGKVEIGPRTTVYANVALGGEAQIRNASAPDARLVIGSESVIREGVTISAGSQRGGGITRVGNRAYLMAYSHIGHDCQIGDGVTLSNGVQLAGHVAVGDGVIMGGLAAVQQFSSIGQYAFISGLSGINADIIPYGIAIGLHARLGGLNLIGLKRRGVPRQNIHALRAAFRTIFLDEEGTIQARAERAAALWPDVPEVRDVTSFVLDSKKRRIAPARVRSTTWDGAE